MKFILFIISLMLFNVTKAQDKLSNYQSLICLEAKTITDQKVIKEYFNNISHPNIKWNSAGFDSLLLEKKEIKNVIYWDLNLVFDASISANINFERKIMKLKTNGINSLWVKVGYGYGQGPTGEGNVLRASLTLLLTKKSHQLETSAGIDRWTHSNEFAGLYPVIGVGYRYQKDKSGFVFRLGTSLTYIHDYHELSPGCYAGFGFGF